MAQVPGRWPSNDADGESDIDAGTVETARRLADEVLFPAALAIDRAPVIPASYLDRLAATGLYGLYGPLAAGGLGATATTAARVVEALGGASLTTAFVWIQHHNAVHATAAARPSVRDEWLGPLCRGRIRAGVAVAALRRPGPPAVVAEPAPGGWTLHGAAPWVTGWDRIDVVHVGARDGDDVMWALIDAQAGPTLVPHGLDLAAVQSSSTVELRLDHHFVPHDRVIGREPYAAWRERDRRGLRTNGYLAVGVAARCASLLGAGALIAEVDEARDALDRADGDAVLATRAGASLLATRVATALMVEAGGAGMGLDHHAQRLAREATFLLVFGQTAEIKATQRAALMTSAVAPASLRPG